MLPQNERVYSAAAPRRRLRRKRQKRDVASENSAAEHAPDPPTDQKLPVAGNASLSWIVVDANGREGEFVIVSNFIWNFVKNFMSESRAQ